MSKDPEKALREIWTAEGVTQEQQEEILAEITAAAQPGAMVGPFMIPFEIRKMDRQSESSDTETGNA